MNYPKPLPIEADAPIAWSTRQFITSGEALAAALPWAVRTGQPLLVVQNLQSGAWTFVYRITLEQEQSRIFCSTRYKVYPNGTYE